MSRRRIFRSVQWAFERKADGKRLARDLESRINVVFLLVEEDDILHIKGCSSPVQRDFDILLGLPCFLIFIFCA